MSIISGKIKQGQMIGLVCLVACLAGCAVTPGTVTKQPTSKIHSSLPPAPANGSIYQAASFRPLFEDIRAHRVGDVLTIAISETTNASKTASSSGSKSGSVAAAIPTIVGLPLKTLQGTNVQGSTANKSATTDALSSANTFISTITVEVTAVRPDGNLEVAGEKQVALDSGIEYIRFSGVVNPDTIQSGDMVSSTQVADARVEYRTDSRIDGAGLMSSLARFFQSVAPF